MTHHVYLPLAMDGSDGPPPATFTQPFAVISTTAGFRAAYDANGNMVLRVEVSGTQRITYTQAWDAENRLAVVTNTVTGQVTRFWYDGDGNRLLRMDSTGTRVYIGDYYEKQGATVTKYYYAGGQRIAMRQGNTLYFLHGDHLGSATLTTDASGNKLGEQRYSPYGVTRYGSSPTDRQFTGQRNEASLRLYDYGARMYSPSLGRFISADTVIPNPGNPQDLNRYTYARNSPLAYVDPDGHFPWLLLIAALVAVAMLPGDTGPYENTEMNQAIGELAVCVACEPCDYAITMAYCGGGCDPSVWAMMAIPGVPGVAARNMDDISDMVRAANALDDAGDALRATERLDEAVDVLRGAERAAGEVAEEGAERTARGGTYRLVDPATGDVQYVGRTNDLARRQAEHLRDPVKGQLAFVEDWRTDDYAVLRGREQILYEQYRPPLNRIRPISPRNRRLQEYLDAARRFEEMMR